VFEDDEAVARARVFVRFAESPSFWRYESRPLLLDELALPLGPEVPELPEEPEPDWGEQLMIDPRRLPRRPPRQDPEVELGDVVLGGAVVVVVELGAGDVEGVVEDGAALLEEGAAVERPGISESPCWSIEAGVGMDGGACPFEIAFKMPGTSEMIGSKKPELGLPQV
jgi:hypothetical protein